MNLYKTLLLLIALATVDAALELPSYISKCPKDVKKLNECATKQAPRIIDSLVKGDRKYGIPPIDPFYVELIQVIQPGITLNFTKLQFLGFKNSTIKNIIIDDSKMEFIIDFFFPKVKADAHCSMDANLRVIRLKGEGTCGLDMFNTSGHWKASWTKEKHADGLEYVKLFDASLSGVPTKMVFQFDNLINDDPNLNLAVNTLLNENWRDVYEEVRPSVEQALADVTKLTISEFSDRVPFRNLFSS